jgi:hypothetical protein
MSPVMIGIDDIDHLLACALANLFDPESGIVGQHRRINEHYALTRGNKAHIRSMEFGLDKDVRCDLSDHFSLRKTPAFKQQEGNPLAAGI